MHLSAKQLAYRVAGEEKDAPLATGAIKRFSRRYLIELREIDYG
jgi:hypothetical protein